MEGGAEVRKEGRERVREEGRCEEREHEIQRCNKKPDMNRYKMDYKIERH